MYSLYIRCTDERFVVTRLFWLRVWVTCMPNAKPCIASSPQEFLFSETYALAWNFNYWTRWN